MGPSTEGAKADRFNEAVKTITDGVEGVKISVCSLLGVGDQYKTIGKVTTLDDPNTEVSIEHTQGEVMMIDFWATWCPPCQAPMAHNQKMLEENEGAWGGKVKIIGLSIDKDAATVQNHINNKGWTKPIHFHRAKSDCSDVYQVKGVPHVLIVDKTGKIVFKGHPAGRKDLAKDFTDLLEGKELEGVEDKPKAADGEEAAAADGTTTIEDIKKIMGEMDEFKTIGKTLQADNKEKATGMIRNFCVLTLDASLNPNTMTWTSEYINHRVLVGPKEKVDQCNAAIQEKMGTSDSHEAWSFNKVNESI